MKVIIEVKAGEGGEDAKLLVPQQASIYVNYAERHQLSSEVIDQAHG